MTEFRADWRRYLALVGVRQLDVLIVLLFLLAIAPTAIIGRIVRHDFLRGRSDTVGWSTWTPEDPAGLRKMY